MMNAAAELGELPDCELALLRYERIAASLRRPRHLWYASTRRAALTVVKGEFDLGLLMADAMLAEGRRLGEADALNVYTGMLHPLWLERPEPDGLSRVGENTDAQRAAGVPPDSPPTRLHLVQRVVLLAQHGDVERAISPQV